MNMVICPVFSVTPNLSLEKSLGCPLGATRQSYVTQLYTAQNSAWVRSEPWKISVSCGCGGLQERQAHMTKTELLMAHISIGTFLLND